MQASNFKHIIALLVLLIVLGGLYYAATTLNFFGSAMTRAADVEEQTHEIEQEVIAQLDQIKAIKIDNSVFQSEVYKTLEDRSVPPDDVEIARENPFAPF